MAREVTHTARGPYRITAEDVDEEYGDVAICRCGLSDELPFCDGSHRRTEGEAEGVRYKYVDGERREVEVVYVDDGTAAGHTDAASDDDGVRDGDGG